MAVLVFDYRYFGASGGTPRQLLDTRRQREDWRAAIRCARCYAGIDPERIALWGTSFSGGHVVAAAAEDSRIAAVVSQVPLIDAWRGGPGVQRPLLEALKIFLAAFRDAIMGLLGRQPYLIPVFGPPGTAAQFTDPKLKPFFDALQHESSTWRNAITPRLILAPPRYRQGTAERLTMPLLVCVADYGEYVSAFCGMGSATRAARRVETLSSRPFRCVPRDEQRGIRAGDQRSDRLPPHPPACADDP